jgi:hypothetical protein
MGPSEKPKVLVGGRLACQWGAKSRRQPERLPYNKKVELRSFHNSRSNIGGLLVLGFARESWECGSPGGGLARANDGVFRPGGLRRDAPQASTEDGTPFRLGKGEGRGQACRMPRRLKELMSEHRIDPLLTNS